MSMESRSTKSRRRKPPDVFPHLVTRAPTEVVLCGFSLEDGLSYVDRPHRRFHVKPDRDAILCMKTLGLPLRTSEPRLSEATGLDLI